MPAQSYFSPDLFAFLKKLKRNNRREWFEKHRSDYETFALRPAVHFIEDFAPVLYQISPYLVADARPHRGSLFRIYRDTRFSHDKRPYKSHLAMHFSHPGKDVHSPGFYLHLEPGGCFAAAGLWHPDSPTLLKVRNAIVSRPAEWRKLRRLINWDDASRLSRPPRGFPAAHEFVEDLKLRDIGTSVEFTDEQVCSPRFLQTFAATCRKMAPLAEFLSGAVGLKF
ncbi:MAG: DUF2461 domain-containing protein [Terriglobales bacterium]